MKKIHLDYRELIDYGDARWEFVHNDSARYESYFVRGEDPLYPKVFAELTKILPKACRSAFRITRYNVGDYIGKHNDMGPIGFITKRRLTLVMQLSDPNTYEGGDLVFEDGKRLNREQGSYVVFPSYKYHEVQPVLTGVRYSLSWWIT
jgi:PKHD-type hydroxylase